MCGLRSNPQSQLSLPGPFEQAVAKKDLEKACCLLRSLVVHAAGEPRVDMTRVCAHISSAVAGPHGTLRGSLMSVLCSAVNAGR